MAALKYFLSLLDLFNTNHNLKPHHENYSVPIDFSKYSENALKVAAK
jgi:hypothetical protein